MSEDKAVRYVKLETPSPMRPRPLGLSREERELLQRSGSVDTTCESPAPDGSGRVRISQDQAEAPAEMAGLPRIAEEWTARIVESFDLCGHVRYILQVRMPPRKWLIRRSYRDFEQLDGELRRSVGAAGLPSLPPKTSGNLLDLLGPSAEFLAARQTGLQRYLDTLAASRLPVRSHAAVRAFLRAPDPRRRTVFVLDPDAPPLPTDFPDLPAEDAWPAGASPALRSAIRSAVNKAAAALRVLYVFQQTLETDDTPVKRSITFDQHRVRVRAAVAALERFAPEIEALCREAAALHWSKLAAFDAECARVCGQALAWARAFDDEEAAVIRRVVGNEHTVVRPIAYYQRAGAAALQHWRARAADNKWEAAPEAVGRLLDEIEHEMEVRSDAEQTVSVQELRDVFDQLRRGRDLATSTQAIAHQPHTADVLAALRKRVADLGASVDTILSLPQDAATASERLGLLYRVDQLESDVQNAREHIAAHIRDNALSPSLQDIVHPAAAHVPSSDEQQAPDSVAIEMPDLSSTAKDEGEEEDSVPPASPVEAEISVCGHVLDDVLAKVQQLRKALTAAPVPVAGV